MKKVSALILALAMCTAMLTACGGGNSNTTASTGSAAPAPTTSAATSEAGADEGYKLVKEGTLTMATNAAFPPYEMATNAYFPPYEYYDGQDIIGIDVDIAKAIADKMGLELKVEDMEFDSIITAVSTGKADLGLAGMTVTPDRQKNVDFSDSYATGIQSVIVKEDSTITKIDDLQGKKIGVQLSTTGDIYATDDFGKDSVVQYNKGNDAVMALTQGQVDAVIIDNEPAKSYVEANKGLKILDTEYATENYAACISKDNAGLTKAVNKALAELKADGTLQKIVDKYIKA